MTTTTAIRLTNGAIDGMAFSIGENAGPKSEVIGRTSASAIERDAHRDQADVDHEPLRQPLAVRVEEEDADHRPEAGRAHDEEEVLGTQPQDVGREAGTDGAEHADQAGGDAEVGQAPGDARDWRG